MIAGVRDASPTFDICVEAHAKFNMHSAGRIVTMVEPFDVFFLEEPVPPEDIEAMALIQHQTNVPIATGESLQSHYNFREILEKRAARVLQPDLARTGGITGHKKNRRDGRDTLCERGPAQSEWSRVHGRHTALVHVDGRLPDHRTGQYEHLAVQRHLQGRLEG